MMAVECSWWKSRRASVTLACARATLTRAFFLRLLPFCLRGQVPLRPLQPLLRAAQELGAGDFGAVVQDREMPEADVNPAFAIRLREPGRVGFRVRLDHKRCEEPADRITDHRHRGWDGREVTGPMDLDIADLRQSQSAVAKR
jgi:hypothetical protein